MDGFFVIAGILVLVISLYIGTYFLNSKTEAPEGVEKATCSSCHSTSCSLRDKVDLIGSEECEIEKDKIEK